MIIERCSGQLKQCFPILQQTVSQSSENVPKLICSFILHNIAKEDPEPELPEFGEDFALTEDDSEDSVIHKNHN